MKDYTRSRTHYPPPSSPSGATNVIVANLHHRVPLAASPLRVEVDAARSVARELQAAWSSGSQAVRMGDNSEEARIDNELDPYWVRRWWTAGRDGKKATQSVWRLESLINPMLDPSSR
ncbi:hypothetical protein [Oryza sativa Japonica Group]|uniref:Uncharacterized protein n=1 Tax=Oryza sativa subsp. japonica TaxID=39947 RepID=Q657Y1_ORYSJ|nr:hypothetical protein [Oryza sativa Japonica Group]BAD44888.1 hypothetical protein [Oryza sativa Japonica Group]